MMEFENALFSKLNKLEWLVTNGLGGYASSTLSGANSRRYHGVLVAALTPPTSRQVLVAKVEEEILRDQSGIPLGTGLFPHQIIHPQGYRHLTAFERFPLPRFLFEVEDYAVSKTIFMVHESNTTVLKYTNESASSMTIQIMPLFVCREDHHLFQAYHDYDFPLISQNDYIEVQANGDCTPVFVGYPGGSFIEERDWYRNFEYFKEHDRGLDSKEDAYRLGFFKYRIMPGRSCYLILSTDENMMTQDPRELEKEELQRIANLTKQHREGFKRDLLLASDQFVVQRNATKSHSMIAGYPWFTDWGRDTMIALRGLCTIPGKKDVVESILQTFLSFIDQGMIPNRFPDTGEEPEYNSIDASLWIFVALWDYFQKFQDKAFVGSVLPALAEIIHWYMQGTHYDISMSDNGLLCGGSANTQLTWMDVNIEGDVITPRDGYPVEVNALWYNALRIFQDFCAVTGYAEKPNLQKRIREILPVFEESFQAFFTHEAGYLHDVIARDGTPDTRIRPNQIFAISLPYPLVQKQAAIGILDTIHAHLYTPYGLRSLSLKDPDFEAEYAGGVWDRDAAYHQGTVWPYLLADYFIARIRLFGMQDGKRSMIKESLDLLKMHFYENACIHGFSEVFDGLSPEEGKGTIHQAWTASAVITLMDILENANTHLKPLMQFPEDTRVG